MSRSPARTYDDDDDYYDRREYRRSYKRDRDDSPSRRDRGAGEREHRYGGSPPRRRDRYGSPPRRDRDRYSSPSRRRDDYGSSKYNNKRRKGEDEWSPRRSSRSRSRSRTPPPRSRYDHEDTKEKDKRKDKHLFSGPFLSFEAYRREVSHENLSQTELEKRFEEYQAEYKKEFFNQHKNDEWMKEKYDPNTVLARYQEKIETAKKAAKHFAETMDDAKAFVLEATIEDIRKSMEARPQESHADSMDTEMSEEGKEESNKHEPSCSLFVKAIPGTVSRAAMVEFFKKAPGFKKLVLSEPNRQYNFTRLGWAHYETADHAQAALKEFIGNSKVNDHELILSINKEQLHKQLKITPPVAAEEARVQIDLEQAQALCQHLDKEKGIEVNPLLVSGALDSYSTSEKLDRFVIYLRKVHMFCYYCGDEFEDEDDMAKKCDSHLRPKKRDTETNIDARSDPWAQSLDTKIKSRLAHTVNPDEFSGKLMLEQKMDKFAKKNIVKLEEEKYRCALCTKLFCGDNFVKKHQSLKHLDQLEKVKTKVYDKQFLENYLNDPKKIVGAVPPPQRQVRPPRLATHQGLSTPQYRPPPPQYKRRPTMTPRTEISRPPPVNSPPETRVMRDYVDIDAVSEEAVQIDYRIGDLKKKKAPVAPAPQ